MARVNYKRLDLIEERSCQQRNKLCVGKLTRLLGDVYVGGEGSSDPQVFIFGEAPGAHEVLQQRPFVGPAGLVLRDLMACADLHAVTKDFGHQANCWLTNTVKFRPSGNHTPSWFEVRPFRELLRHEWLAVGAPNIIIPVGAVALTAVYGFNHGISILKIAGTRLALEDRYRTPYWLCPMIHPSFALRNENIRPTVERHWKELGEWLNEHHR